MIGYHAYHVFIDVFEKHQFADKLSSRVADKYSASNLPSVPHIMDIAVKWIAAGDD